MQVRWRGTQKTKKWRPTPPNKTEIPLRVAIPNAEFARLDWRSVEVARPRYPGTLRRRLRGVTVGIP
eukprot:3940699-Rhodomonas_salina.6